MKKKILTLAAFVMLAITTTFANDNDISKNVQTAFTNHFATATDVKWETENSYYKVSFTQNGQSLTALVSKAGNTIAVSRNILSTDLPINLQRTLNKHLTSAWITGVVEYALGDETIYFMTVQNADYEVVLKSVGTDEWSLLKVTDK